MSRRFARPILATFVVCGCVAVGGSSYLRLRATGPAAPNAQAPPATQRALLDRYCVTCHNARLRTAGLELDTADLADVGGGAEVWEKVVRKLRADAMPPPGRPRPAAETRAGFASWLETALDREAAAHPNPGRPAIHRLNRTEYVNAIRDLLGLEVDARSLLPGDNSDVHGFDNNADILSISPLLMERYLSAARKISRLVVGRVRTPDFYQHRVHKWMVQEDRMNDDLPFGSRGGTAVPYFFPADGEYEVQVELQRTGNQHIKGLGSEHQLDVRLDGALIERFTIGGEEWVKLAPLESYSGNINVGLEWEDYSHNMDRDLKVRFPVQAGRRVVGVSFVGRQWELEGVIVTQPQVGVSLSRNEIPDGNPSVASVTISGPLTVTGPGEDTLPRRKIFVCQPSSGADEAEDEACAREILSPLARRAYRRPVTEQDVRTLLSFHETGRAEGSFEAGIQFNVSNNAGASLHSRASTRWLTGVRPREGQSQAAVYAGVSVDQIVAKEIGQETQLASLELALEPNDFAGSCDPGFSCAYVTTVSWRNPATPLPMEHNPRVVFERLFGDAGTTDPAARLARIKKDRSILDSVVEEANRLAGRVGAGDRLKLEQYLDAIRDIERRLRRAVEQNDERLPVVDQPTAIPDSYEEYAKLMFDLQVLAYQADLTRIQTFMLGRELSARQYPEIGAPDAHHPTSHHTNDPEKIANYGKINAFHTRLFAYYVDKLRATPDGDGSLLDHIVLLYGSGMSDGNAHATGNLPLVVMGGGAGKGGRHIRYPDDTPLPNLHLTLLDRMGVHIDTLGDSTGRLEHLSIV